MKISNEIGFKRCVRKLRRWRSDVSFWQEFHIENGLTIDHILKGHESFFVASFRAGLARELKQILHHDPLDASENLDAQPAHVLVVGDKPKKGFSKKVAKDSSWVIETPAKADAV
jgi:hypothetical protein